MDKLGKTIRLLRHQKSWSQKDTAEQLDISVPAFSKIETGITDVNLSRLQQIAKLLDMNVVQLLSYANAGEIQEHKDKLEVITKKIQQRENEIIHLQKKLIQLYEQLYSADNV